MRDRLRPRYHLTAEHGWINDPNGPIRHEGIYHVFAQHNPVEPVHRDVHWAHWTSRDLLSWTAEPVALTPRPGAADADGCYSGSAIVVDGELLLVYSGHRADQRFEAVCIARPAGDGTWVADPDPVIVAPPPHVDAAMMRDPFLWRDGDEVRMLIGSGDSVGRPMALVFASRDLAEWRFVGLLCDVDDEMLARSDTGAGWECPHLLRDGRRGFLVVSAWSPPSPLDGVRWISGQLDGDRLTPAMVGRVDYGPDFYAADLMVDDDGVALMWAWCWEARDSESVLADGWAGVLSAPRVVELDDTGVPAFAPAPQLLGLRRARHTYAALVRPQHVEMLDDDLGRSLDLEVRFAPGLDGAAWLRVLVDPDGREFTEIGLDARAGEVYLARSESGVSRGLHRGRFSMPVLPDDGGAVDVRILVDVSVVEVFACGRSITARVYPELVTSIGLAVGGARAEGKVEIEAWTMSDPDAQRPTG